MSLPPHVQWVYDHHPEVGSEEEKLITVLKSPKTWA
jgi:coproporphyrinogen III oxidase